jgi:hypothetical protein
MNPSVFRSNLKTQLQNLSAYNTLGAVVFAYPPGQQATTKPTIFLNQVENVTESEFTLAGNQEELFSITGGGYAPGDGSNDTQWGTMETNAWTLLSGLIGQLVTDSTVNGACSHAHVTSWSMTPAQMPENNRVFMDFEFTITARVFP